MDLQRISELGFENISIWYSFVLVLSFSMWWNIFIAVMCFGVYVLSTSVLAFHINLKRLALIFFCTDTCYLVDVVFTISYLRNPRLRKLKFAKCRHWVFLLVDMISLLPLDLLFRFHYVSDNKNPLVRNVLMQNRSLRIYRVILLEWFYMPTIRAPWKFVICTLILFLTKSAIIAHFFSCIWYNLPKGVPCDSKRYNCYLWHEGNMFNVLLLNWAGPKKMFTEFEEQIVVTCAVLVGFFIIFAYIYPYTFYYCILIGCRDSVVFEKRKRLNKFLSNMIKEADLREKITRFFNYAWGEGEDESELQQLLNNVPLALQKEIFTDIYWEAFRHSFLLRDTSRSFKRSLSLMMTTQYHFDGEVVYFKEQDRTNMIFLVQGILQVMAEENEKSPLLSFSSGTVFGELSLFLLTKNQALVKCKGSCELQILSCRKILSALMDYPKDKKLVFQKFHEKLTMAKHTQWRKKRFKEDQKLEMLSMEPSYFTVVDCVKWLKIQWRHSWEGHKRHLDVIRAKAEGTRLPSWRLPVRPDIKIEFISNFLDLVVLSNILEEKKGIVCLKTTFPFSIDPETQFLRIWKYVILTTALIPALAYPICTAWFYRFPFVVYLCSYVVTLLFIIDVLLKLITAVKTKHSTITSFKDVLRHNFKTPTFYLDIIAALPYQIYILVNWDVNTAKAFHIGLILHPAIVKMYLFIAIGNSLGPYLDIVTLTKNCLMYFFLLYWLSDIIQLHGMWNVGGTHNEWIDRYLEGQYNKEFLRHNLVSVFRALVIAISIPSFTIYSDNDVDMYCACIIRYLFFLFSCYFVGSYYSSIVVKRFGTEMYRILIDRLKSYLVSRNVADKIVSRTIRSMNFQWLYDKASYITSDVPILNSLPFNIRRQVFLETTYKALELSPLFQGEPSEYLLEVLEISDFIAVPRGLVLVTYGHTSHILIIINRGYCQLNSHLENDITANLGRPVILGPGSTFPLLSSFCNVPAPISVVTTTDCELIVIDLNKLISLMLKYNLFKDIVDVMKESKLAVKLLASRPALMKICTADQLEDESDWEIQGYGVLRQFFYVCWKKFSIFAHTTFLKGWGYFYLVYLFVHCLFWPSCFGVLLFQSHIIMPLLVAGKLVVVLHITIRTLFPYYNKEGLLVSHPLYTLVDYLSSSFFLDVIRVLPIFSIYYYGFADPYSKPNDIFVWVAIVQCYLGLIYVMGCIDYIASFFNEIYYAEMVKFLLFFGLIFNLHVNLCMSTFSTWTFGGPYQIVAFQVQSRYKPVTEDLLRENNVADYYLYITYWILATMTTNEFDLLKAQGTQLYLQYIHGFAGTIISYYLYVSVSSTSKFGNMGGATFREQFSSVTKYLEHEKTDDKTIERVKLYCRYVWSKTGGENIKEMFGQLPLYLLEELWYPLYRPTFVKNSLFENADEGFFRILATHVTSVFFTRGSLVIFKKETQEYIYFLHRGKCFVYDWFIILDIGSIVGDVQQTGRMLNKVYALTHVEMLKISSQTFFTIINNFDHLESNFLYVAKKAESFIKSDVYRDHNPLRPVDSKDAVNAFELRKKEIGFEDESQFEDPENMTTETFRYKPKEKRTFIIYPQSWFMRMIAYVAFLDVVLTVLSIPSFVMFGGLSMLAFIFIGALDFLWLIIVIITFFVGLQDHEKGDVITSHKFIAKRYLSTTFVFDLISLIPFELIPVLWVASIEKANAHAVLYLRLIRYFRVYSFYKFQDLEVGMIKNECAKKCLFNILLFIWSVIALSAIFVKITREPLILAAKNDRHYQREQVEAALDALLYVCEELLNNTPRVVESDPRIVLGLNPATTFHRDSGMAAWVFPWNSGSLHTLVSYFVMTALNLGTSANVPTISPKTRAELIHFNFSVVILICIKGMVISSILSLMYVRNLSTFNYKARVTKMENYLKKKEASPIIVKGLVDYQTNLFRFSRSENMPLLLMRLPMTIRIPLMKDLFKQHVVTFPLYEGLEDIFLDQLIARAKREVYFPGEKIVEQGDVDHRHYFIHSGEVYVINQTKERAYVEFVVGKMHAGEYFGEAQGLWFNKPHVYTYRGRTLVEIIALHADDWMDLRRTFPDTAFKIFERAKTLRYI